MQKFPAEKILELFQEMGIYPKDRNGYIYPNSDQASSVAETLQEELERTGVEVHTGVRCLEIRREKMDLRSVRREKFSGRPGDLMCRFQGGSSDRIRWIGV